MQILVRRILAALVFLIALPAPASADDATPAPADTPAPAGEVRLGQSFGSAALGRDLAYSIYLPPGYDADGSRTYPVLYLLHGIGGDGSDWFRIGNVGDTIDRMIAAGSLAPLIAVSPSVGNSWYLDSAAVGGPGDFGTAVVRDLTAHVEGSYRARTDRDGRAIAGLSMGGFGALRLGFEHPELFAVIGSYSAPLYWQFGAETRARLGVFEEVGAEFGNKIPPSFFAGESPFAYMRSLLAAQPPPSFFLVAGDDDPFGTATDLIEVRHMLRTVNIPASLRITAGAHEWSVWRWAIGEHLAVIGATTWRAQ